MRLNWLGFMAGTALLAAVATSGCTRAGGASDARPDLRAAQTESTRTAARVLEIEQLRAAGQFAGFGAESLRAADEHPRDAALQLLAGEAALATGYPRDAEAAAARAIEAVTPLDDAALREQAVKLWAIARLRGGRPLDPAQLSGLAATDPALAGIAYWTAELAGRQPYALQSAPDEPTELILAESEPGSLAYELLAVQGSVNGEPLSTIFIDTGAQHTIMTEAAAQRAGVHTGAGTTELTGFAGFSTQSGVLDKLALGDVVLRNVPVLVGDSPALVAAEGDLSLGCDLLYHLHVRLDYPRRQVHVEPAQANRSFATNPGAWSIPLWCFSQVALARGELDSGVPLRVLVDTGDRAGTYVSYRWARRTLPELAGVNSGMVFRFKKRNLTLPELVLGDAVLPARSVVDTLPPELDRLNLVDVLLGHDLLRDYRLTIDLARRQLVLKRGNTQTPSPSNYDLP